jgi:hypothetical protein
MPQALGLHALAAAGFGGKEILQGVIGNLVAVGGEGLPRRAGLAHGRRVLRIQASGGVEAQSGARLSKPTAKGVSSACAAPVSAA